MNTFNIREHVIFNEQGRAICPSCALTKGPKHKNPNLSVQSNGAYKCFAGCTPQDIRSALDAPKPQQIPSALAATSTPAKNLTISPQKVKEAHENLMQSNGPAKQWLLDRGISEALMQRHQLGISRAKCGDRHLQCIVIPIPNGDGTAYYQKKRIAPWLAKEEQPEEYKPWSQAGIPAKVWFSYLPAVAQQTWLCEGEWDAILLGALVRHKGLEIAVCSFTCGASTVPPQEQLDLMPGEVIIWYDRNDTPTKKGDRPGEVGAKKVAKALGARGKIALVPMPDGCQVTGWDVSDAIGTGYELEDFQKAATQAIVPTLPPGSLTDNPLRANLYTNDELIEAAPDYTEWLVQDLLTANELFLVAAGPRAGKSLLAMTLARAIASGETFLERPVIQGNVLYVCLEDSPAKIKEREIAQGWVKGLPVYWLKRFKLSQLPHLKEIAEELDPRLIIIDTLARAKDGNISESSSEMSQLLEPLQEMAEDLDCCILLVHHTGKISVDNANQVDIFDTIRGSSAIRAVCRGSMVIAASDRDYRLVAENGWGKHDLKVVLDANTITWKLLGRWSPAENVSHKELILDCLRQMQQASLEQIHEATGIPKKSLYEQLSRLQVSSVAEEKICKEGSRRKYTYRLAYIQHIQQLNSVLNSANSDPSSDTGYIQQKSFFPKQGDHQESDQSGTCDALITLNDHPLPPTTTDTVEYRPANVDPVGVSPIQQLFNTPFCESTSNAVAESDTRYSTPPPESDHLPEVLNSDKKRRRSKATPPTPTPPPGPLTQGTPIEVMVATAEGDRWLKATYLKPGTRSRVSLCDCKLHAGHWVRLGRKRHEVSENDIRPVGYPHGGDEDA